MSARGPSQRLGDELEERADPRYALAAGNAGDSLLVQAVSGTSETISKMPPEGAPLEAGQASYAGLLTPQGKVLFDFFVIREAQGYLIDCLEGQRQELAKRLKFYRLRAKLVIDGAGRLGLFEAGSHDVVDLPGCRILTPELQAVPKSGVPSPSTTVSIGLTAWTAPAARPSSSTRSDATAKISGLPTTGLPRWAVRAQRPTSPRTGTSTANDTTIHGPS